MSANICDSAGYTALHYAAMKGHIDICELLLNCGADVNAQTRAGQATALHRACTVGKFQKYVALMCKLATPLPEKCCR